MEVVGDPEFEFSLTDMGGAANDPPATYDRTRSTATTIVFTYTVQAGDRDNNGIWIGNHSRTFMLDVNDRIRTASQQIDIDRSHPEYGTHTAHKVDGSLGAPTVPPDPTAPTLVSATATTLTIEWTHPGDGGSPLTRNFIEYRVEGTTDWTNWYRGETPTPVTRTVITNLAAETAYDVRVHATNAIGNSSWVQSATAFSTLAGMSTNTAATATVTPAAGTPGSPRNLSATVGVGQVVLVWERPDNSTGLSHYEYRSSAGEMIAPDAMWQQVQNCDTRPNQAYYQVVKGLTGGTTHTLQVRAVNAQGGSAPAIVPATPLSQPSCTIDELGDRRRLWQGQLTAGIVAVFTDGNIQTGYGEGGIDPGTLTPDAVTFRSTTYSVTTWTSLDHLNVVLRDPDSNNWFPREEVVDALRLHVCNTPYDFSDATVADVFAEHGDYRWDVGFNWPPGIERTLRLSLPPNHPATGDPVISGTVQVGQTLTAVTTGIMDDDGLDDVFTYQWVRVDADGTSNEADITDATAATYTLTDDDLGKKVKIEVSFPDDFGSDEQRTTAGDGRVTLAWTAPGSDGGAAIEKYRYRVSANAGSSWDPDWTDVPDGADAGDSAADETTFTVSGLSNGTEYVFELRAVNSVGEGRAATLTAASGSPRLAASARTIVFTAPGGGASGWTIDGVGAGNSSPYSYGTSGSLLMSVNGTTARAQRAVREEEEKEEEKEEPDPDRGISLSTSSSSAIEGEAVTNGVRRAGPTDRTTTVTVRLASVEEPYSVGSPSTLTFNVTERDAALSVDDASVSEGPGATLAFAVTLDRTRDREVRVKYATSDGTATQGEDYTGVSGTLRFAPGETSKTVSVPVLDDAHDEGSETLTLRLSTARRAVIDDATAVGTIVNSVPLPNAWLSRFGRAASDHVVQSIGRRLEGGESESHLTVMGWRVDTLLESTHSERDGREPRADAPGRQANGSVRAPDGRIGAAGAMAGGTRGFGAMSDPGAARPAFDGAMTQGFPPMQGGTLQSPARAMGASDNRWLDLLGRLFMALGPNGGEALATPGLRDMVMGSSFYYGYSPDAGPLRSMNRLTAWGESASTRFSGAEGKLSLDGEVNTAILGADGEWGRWLAGLALSYSEGEGGYRRVSAKGGAVSSTLTGINPYARYRLDERTSFWATLGYGSGRLALTPDRGRVVPGNRHDERHGRLRGPRRAVDARRRHRPVRTSPALGRDAHRYRIHGRGRAVGRCRRHQPNPAHPGRFGLPARLRRRSGAQGGSGAAV